MLPGYFSLVRLPGAMSPRLATVLVLLSLLLLNVVVATPDTPANGTLNVVSGTAGGGGWYRSAVGMDFNAHGRVANGSYSPIQGVGFVRDGALHGNATYVDEFEAPAGWTASSLQGAADPTLRADASLVQQGFASLNVTAVQPADAHDHQAKISRAASLDLSAYDTAKLTIHYETTHSGYLVGGVYVGRQGNVTLKLLDGAQTALSQAISLSPGAWNPVTLDLTTMSSRNVTSIEVDIDSPRATYDITTNETQWLNLDAFRAYAKADLVESTEGDHLWHVRVTDGAGAQDAADVHVKLDVTPPTTSASIAGTQGDNGWYVSSTQVLFNATDALSGVSRTLCREDGSSLMNCPGYVLIWGDGVHTVEYWSLDVAGNEEAHKTIVVRQDKTAPTVSVSQSTANGCGLSNWCNSTVTLTLRGNDATSGIRNVTYRVNGGAWTNSSTAVTLTFANESRYSVDSYATDNAGNVGAMGSYALGVDKQKPVLDSYGPNGPACPSDIVAVLFHDPLPAGANANAGVNLNATTLTVQQHVGVAPADKWVDVTNTGTVRKDAGSITWESSGPMAVGDYRASVAVQDYALNAAGLTWSFTVGLYSYC